MVLAALALAGWVLAGTPRSRSASPSPPRPVDRFEAVSAELRRGASLRVALASTAPGSRMARLALSGQPMEAVVGELAELWNVDDALLRPGTLLAAIGGAPAAELFDRLADRARAATRLAHRRVVLTAQARMSAVIVGLLPLVIGLLVLATRSGELLTTPAARWAVALGMSLHLAGVASVAWFLRRSLR